MLFDSFKHWSSYHEQRFNSSRVIGREWFDVLLSDFNHFYDYGCLTRVAMSLASSSSLDSDSWSLIESLI